MTSYKSTTSPGQSSFTLAQLPFFADLQRSGAKNVLLGGCGGGFDIYSGIPLYFALCKAGYNVVLWNLTFTRAASVVNGKKVTECLYKVNAHTKADSYDPYFPERYLSEWFFEKRNEKIDIYTLIRVKPTVAAFEAVVAAHGIDAIVLVDGGTDSLMRGDEVQLGSPTEDTISIAAVHQVNVPHKYLVCLGYGVDAFHGVCHSLFLENAATLITEGHFLGVFSLMREMEEAAHFESLCKHVFSLMGETSIVASSILSAMNGFFGDYHATERTMGTELFINPLMAIYWCFHIEGVAKGLLYMDRLVHTETVGDVQQAIADYRSSLDPSHIRQRIPFPH